jgi:hypothetical protein
VPVVAGLSIACASDVLHLLLMPFCPADNFLLSDPTDKADLKATGAHLKRDAAHQAHH